jgi:hypothetical protein
MFFTLHFGKGFSHIPILLHQYPSMGPGLMQGALPSMSMPQQQPLMRSSSVEGTSPRWMTPQQMPYASAVDPSNILNIILAILFTSKIASLMYTPAKQEIFFPRYHCGYLIRTKTLSHWVFFLRHHSHDIVTMISLSSIVLFTLNDTFLDLLRQLNLASNNVPMSMWN